MLSSILIFIIDKIVLYICLFQEKDKRVFLHDDIKKQLGNNDKK